MNKPRNRFANLPEQDRQLILNLCSERNYDKAVDILKLPRSEGGLDLHTSKSALCRFFTLSHPETSLAVLTQYARAIQVRHEQYSNSLLGAIRAMVEARVLETLQSGKALPDMEADFKILRTVQGLYLEDARWRSKSPNAPRAAYRGFVQLAAQTPEIDFMTNEEVEKEAATQSPYETHFRDFDDLTGLELDILSARADMECEAQEQSEAAQTAEDPSVPEPETAKSPVIPHIPLNSTSLDSTSPSQLNPSPMSLGISNRSADYQSSVSPIGNRHVD